MPLCWERHKFMVKLKFIKEKMKKSNVEVFRELTVLKLLLSRRLKELNILESLGNKINHLKEERFIVESQLEKIILKEKGLYV